MKYIYPIALFTSLYGPAMEAISAPICGDWNNYENCVNYTYPFRGTDQGSISKTHYDNFVNNISPNYERYRTEQTRNNIAIQNSLENEINNIDQYFIQYAKGLKAWKAESPGSFFDYFNTDDETHVLLDKLRQFENIIADIYNNTYNSYMDLFLKINQSAVERIEYNYWAKAYFPAISGVWGFQPSYWYGYSYDVLDGLTFITRGGNEKSYTGIKFFDRWNSAATQPTTRTEKNTVYVQINRADFDERINSIHDKFLHVQPDNQIPCLDLISYVMEFESKLMQLSTLDSLDDKNTKHFLYGMSYIDHDSKEDAFKDVFYSTQSYAESNAISLVYAYAVNRDDPNYFSKLQRQLEKVKTFSWYDNASELYKQIIEGILAKNDSPINIVLNDRYINYVIDNNKMEVKGWHGGVIQKGDMRSYVNPYHNDQLEVMKAKITSDFSANNQFFPTEQNSNGNWEFVGIIFSKDQYRDFIHSVDYKTWGKNTFPGDIHESNGKYFSPKFNGNPLNGNKAYPSGEESNENWLYLGNNDKPADGMYSYIIYSRFYHDLYSQMLKLWLYNLQNNDTSYVNIDMPLQQFNVINKTLTSVMAHSEKSWRYATYSLVDSALILNADADFRMQAQLWLDFDRMMNENMSDLIELQEEEGEIPEPENVLEKWANDEWNPPDEFTESWYPRALARFGNLEEIKEFLERIPAEIEADDIGVLMTTFSNATLVNLINAMAITSNLTIATETIVTTSALATIFGIFL